MSTRTQLMRLPGSDTLNGHIIPPPERANPNSLYIGKPVAYHIALTSQICRSCGTYHEHSQVSLAIVGPRHKIFRSVAKFEFNLPIFIFTQEPDYVPACHTCAQALTLSHLPPPPDLPKDTPSVVRAKWRMHEGKAVKTTPAAPKPKSARDLEI